jgi:mRNA interferase RelE/StbE
LTIYKIEFVPSALKEWRKLDHTLRAQLKKKLQELTKNPHIPSARLKGTPNAYRVKARAAGYRLIYEVEDKTITIFIMAIGKRERGEVFDIGIQRLRDRRD